MAGKRVTVQGIFAADLTFRARSIPGWGETLLGEQFRLGPGGKGSNQAIAAARLGAEVVFITKLGRDMFGELARRTYAAEGVSDRHIHDSAEQTTGAAAIVVDAERGENAIIVVPGASDELTLAEVEAAASDIAASSVFLTQFELKLPVVERGMRIAAERGVKVILNPAPALAVPASIYASVDYLTPNESEAKLLSGLPVDSVEEAARAADFFLAHGVHNVVITLGARGVLVKNAQLCEHVPAVEAGRVLDTTGAGDAFNGGFAVALAEGADLISAARFGCAVAGVAVTRVGTAPAMPRREEVEALLASGDR
jgi:ribokinase